MSRHQPTRLLLLIAILAMACVTAWAAALTTDDVVRMGRAGRSDSEILDAINQSQATFDLTANDIANLRQAGVSQKVIDAMIATGPADQEPPADQVEEQGAAEASPYVPPPVYPIYPLYYPVYYPVYDPFFPVYGGFFFSFGFVHVSNLFTIFPCDRAFVVVNRSLFGTGIRPRWSSFARGGEASRATVRVIPRGSSPPISMASRIDPRARGGESRLTTARTMRPQRSWGQAGTTGIGSRPRSQQNPQIRSQSTLRTQSALRYQSMPRSPRSFQGMPRSPGQSFLRPGGGFMAPRTGFAGRPQGSFGRPAQGFAPRSFGGGHGGGSHMGGAAGHGHGGHH
jgi:uncharacterized protein YdbL (DUF1318 family)